MGSTVLWLFCQLAYYGETAVGRLYQQLEPPPRPALCFLLLLVLLLRQPLRPLRMLPGSSADSILSSPPRIYPVLPRQKPRAEPLSSPGNHPELRLHHGLERGAEQDLPLRSPHTHNSFLPIRGRPARAFLGWSSFLPTPLASVFSPNSADKLEVRTRSPQTPRCAHLLPRTIPHSGTQGQTRASASAPAV